MKKELTMQQLVTKKGLRKIGWVLVVYGIIFNIFVAIITFIQTMGLYKDNPNISLNSVYEMLSASGISSICGVTAGGLFIFLYRKKTLFRRDLTYEKKKMTQDAFFKLYCCVMSLQFVFVVLKFLMQNLLNLLGYRIIFLSTAETANQLTVSMFLYVSFFAPVVEEILFRGALLRLLEKYGRTFAIMTTAILFGIFQGNVTQGIFAMLMGVILGYVTIEYSLKWAILLHIINTFIFRNILTLLTQHMPETLRTSIYYVIILSFFIAGCYYFFHYRTAIRNYFKEYAPASGAYRYFFTSPAFIFFALLNLLALVFLITQLL